MLIRIEKAMWISGNNIVAIMLDGSEIIISLATKAEVAKLNLNSSEGKAFMYWLERNSNDIIKHYEGLRVKDDNNN